MKIGVSIKTIAAVMIFLAASLQVARAQIVSSNTCTNAFNDGTLSKYTLGYGAVYIQSNAFGAVPYTTNSILFEAAISKSTNRVSAHDTNASLDVPGQPVQTMFYDGGGFELAVGTNSFSNLTAAFPAGSYGFSVSNENTVYISFPSGVTLPNAPVITNFDAAQTVDPTKDFTLMWQPFVGGTTADYIEVDLDPENGFGPSLSSETYTCSGALNGTDTSVVIPADTMTTNTTYRLSIVFVKVLVFDTNSIPGVSLQAGAETETEAILTTTSGSGSGTNGPFSLTNVAASPGGTISFNLQTTPGFTYTIQYNQNLSDSAGWVSLLTTDAVNTIVSFTNTPPGGVTSGFYRALHN